MDGNCLGKWISSDLPVTLASLFSSPSTVWWLRILSVLVFIHTWASVASSPWEAQPIPGSSYLTPLGKFWLFPLSYFCNTWGNSLIYLWLWAPQQYQINYNLKLNYFPQTEHIIPHMNKLLLLETIIFTIYESNMYSELTQWFILGEIPLKSWLFLKKNTWERDLEIPTAKT